MLSVFVDSTDLVEQIYVMVEEMRGKGHITLEQEAGLFLVLFVTALLLMKTEG